MGETDSNANILSNFMVFSKNNKPVLESGSSKISSVFNSNTYISFVICVIIVCIILVVYYQRGGWGEYDWILNINLEKWWLSTHLNEAGELASTYVPTGLMQKS